MDTTRTFTLVEHPAPPRSDPAALVVADARPRAARGPSLGIRVDGVSYRAGGTTILDRIDLVVPARQLVAIAGASGAGKTTLIEIIAGVRRPSAGDVRFELASGADPSGSPTRIGVVPQDDIIHPHLPLRRTLLHAARLRLSSSERHHAGDVVDATLELLGLADQAALPVGSLSGGQRKRASIAVELLTDPEVLVLDEPTSGLDPERATEVVDALQSLVARGITVVMTTHHPDELARCDHVVFLAPGGRVAFAGSPDDALERLGVDDLGEVYGRMRAGARTTPSLVRSVAGDDARDRRVRGGRLRDRPGGRPLGGRPLGRTMGASPIRQWLVLSARSAEVMARNRLTLAILLGSPALVIAMMVVLFPAGAFDDAIATAVGPVQTAYWMAFSSFFFGLTYGLLQIVTERAVLRRERHAGLGFGAYLASKVTVLLPLLAVVNAVLLLVLAWTDRLPSTSAVSYPELALTLVLTAAAGLLIGLLASAAVVDPTQATLALPMICFPQVLFAGAIVPVEQMTSVGGAISCLVATRWSFESLGRILMPIAPGSGSTSPYADAFTGSPVVGWIALVGMGAVATVAAMAILRRRTSPR